MKNLIALLPFLACASAVPSPDPVVAPYPSFNIKPVKFSGNGCPVQGTDRRTAVVDYMQGGTNGYTEKGETIWRWWLNLPPTLGSGLWGESTSDNYKSCAHEWQFTNTTGYRLVANPSGSEIAARYRLPKDKSAVWKLTYYLPDGTEALDTVTVDGPLGSPYSTGPFAAPEKPAQSTNPPKSWKTGCDEKDHVFKLKTEVSIEGPGNQWGQIWGATENEFYNRIMQVVSFYWEKCE